MSDLISREALRKLLEEDLQSGGTKTDEFDIGYDLGIETAIEMLDNAPTVDIKDQIAGAYNEGYACGSRENKRPQGEWIRTALYGQTCLECNQCGKSDFYMKYDNFCPNCGAKMKGGAE